MPNKFKKKLVKFKERHPRFVKGAQTASVVAAIAAGSTVATTAGLAVMVAGAPSFLCAVAGAGVVFIGGTIIAHTVKYCSELDDSKKTKSKTQRKNSL